LFPRGPRGIPTLQRRPGHRSQYTWRMRLRRIMLGIGFAAGLVAVYFVPSGRVATYLMVVFAASMLGGLTIGRWWAVAVALGTNIVFSAFLVSVVVLFFQARSHHDLNNAIALVLSQILISAAATAAAVWLRQSLTSPSSETS